MSIPDQDHVSQLLASRREIIAGVALNAWDRWMKNPERPQLYRRVRAGLVHNYMMLDALQRLPTDPGITPIPGQETSLFFIEDQLLIRFKKGDHKGLSSNIDTQAVMAFNNPEENLKLFDLPDVDRVDIAYVLNDLETKIKDVLVVARHDDRVLWSYSIHGSGAAYGADPTIPFPISPMPLPAADSGMRVPEVGTDQEQRKDGAK